MEREGKNDAGKGVHSKIIIIHVEEKGEGNKRWADGCKVKLYKVGIYVLIRNDYEVVVCYGFLVVLRNLKML